MSARLLFVVLAALLSAPLSIASATILTFSINPTPPNDTSIETVFSNYGDYVTSTTAISGPNTYSYGMGNGFTPDIGVSYSHTAGGGNLGHRTYLDGTWTSAVDYLYAFTGSEHFITFTPTGAEGVKLNSFVIDTYSSPSNRVDWIIHDGGPGGSVLASGFETSLSGGENRAVNLGGLTNFGATTLEIVLTDVTGGHVAIDDVNFDQLADPNVPEPSAAALLALGVTALFVRLRQRRR